MSQGGLCFNQAKLTSEEGLELNFRCPSCGEWWRHKGKPYASLPLALNFNALVTFTCPYCGYQIKLYVAFYKGAERELINEVSIEPIPSDWWRPPENVP